MTMYGSANSHTAILARTMNIPAVIGLGEALKEEYDGKVAIVDGVDGKAILIQMKRLWLPCRKSRRKIRNRKNF